VTKVLPDLARAEAAILARGSELGRPLHVLGETSSTSDLAKAAAKQGAPHGSTWLAESQLEGRGRQGRTWLAVDGESLLFSVLLRVRCPLHRLPQLALAAGLAVRDAVGAPALLKWPNDVVVREGETLKKIAGVLVETTTSGRTVDSVIVGIGINVHARAFPEEIADRASSVALALGDRPEPPDRAELLADVLARLDRDAHLVAARGLGLLHARLVEADALAGARVKSESGEGLAAGVDTEGRLLVRADDGTLLRWSAGEVHLVAFGA
jgi:BirA family transcriptional regulator, biotin operon repressor / biotin---[acetyl-CoA-carboxylase] ligase